MAQAYWPRISEQLAIRLHNGTVLRRLNKFSVLDEISFLEKTWSSRPTSTKNAEKFRGPILGRFWHKHYFNAGHLIRNIRNQWTEGYAAKHDLLTGKIREILPEGTAIDTNLAGRLSHALVYEGMKTRMKRGALTGEWFIYYVHEGVNYYLDLANHSELSDQQRLFDRLKTACAWEFPFAFE